MRKLYFLLLTVTTVCLSLTTSAQETRTAAETKRAQNVFVEIGGQGLLFTANYDTRFSNKRNGLGGRLGIGYLALDGDRVTTIPVSLNYLLGKEKHFFEIGLGASFVAAGGDDGFLFDDNESSFIGTMSFTYRGQPVDSGFAFRAGLTPVFNSDFFVPYFGGLSIGYTFSSRK
jgi:hypothetical protein